MIFTMHKTKSKLFLEEFYFSIDKKNCFGMSRSIIGTYYLKQFKQVTQVLFMITKVSCFLQVKYLPKITPMREN